MPATDAANNQAADREMVIARIFNVSREIAFKAWSEPGRLAQWLGPQGFTSTIGPDGCAAGW